MDCQQGSMVTLLRVKQEFTCGISVSKMAIKKAWKVRSFVKVMFYDFNSIAHHEFLSRGQTINKKNYLQVQHCLREAIWKKRPVLLKDNSWLLHYDNAPAHTSLLVREFLVKNNTVKIPQPPYSPDMAPCDFFLLPKIKRTFKGHRWH